MTAKRRSHKNNLSRLTAKERVDKLWRDVYGDKRLWVAALQAHAREAVERYKRKHSKAGLPALRRLLKMATEEGMHSVASAERAASVVERYFR